jgi:U3 small nucleolar RNA-associated protein 14
MNISSESDNRTINNTMRHQYRVLTEEEKKAMVAVKDAGLAFLETLDKFCQPGREASLAKTKVEEAVMWAVKGLTA